MSNVEIVCWILLVLLIITFAYWRQRLPEPCQDSEDVDDVEERKRPWVTRAEVTGLLTGGLLVSLVGIFRVVWVIGVANVLKIALVCGICFIAGWLIVWLCYSPSALTRPSSSRGGRSVRKSLFQSLGVSRRITLTFRFSSIFLAGVVAYKLYFTPTPLKAAQEIKEKIDAQEKNLGALNGEVVKTLSSGVPKSDVDPNTASAAILLQEVKRLREIADQLLADHEKYVEAFQSLTNTLTQAPACFRKLAEEYASYERSEPFDELKKEYHQMSLTWLALAERTENRARTLKDSVPPLNDSLEFLRRTALFLQRLETSLEAYPITLGNPEESRQKIVEKYKLYIGEYDSLRNRLKEFHIEVKTPKATGKEGAKPK
jgi:hypothetical protein